MDFGVFDAFKIWREQSIQLFWLNAERRAFQLIAHKKETGQQGAGRKKFSDTPAPVSP